MRFVAAGKHALGLDGAIAYTVLARFINILGSTGTVLLLVHFLSPTEQGFYYSLLSLVNLQIIFELGFAFVIQQFAAHESVHLQLSQQGHISGNARSIDRLSLLLKRALQWYSVAGVLLGVTLGPFGIFFFTRHARAAAQVHWQGPWYAALGGCVIILILDPMFSFLEGCGWVRQVAGMRLCQALLGVAMAWTTFLSGHGLFSPAMVILGNIVAGSVFLFRFRKLLFALLSHAAPSNAISWRSEIWHFQWRIAVSWLSTYVTSYIVVPAVFLLRTPVEAGQMGMSLSIVGYMWNVVLAWISTKATPFGQMVAKRDFQALDRLFLSTLLRALAIMASLMLIFLAGVLALQHFYPRLAARMVPPPEFCLLLVAALCMLVIQCLAVYLRSHKKEPYLLQAPATALVTVAGIGCLVPHWGLLGATSAYCLGVAGVGLPWALVLFGRTRKNHVQETGTTLIPPLDPGATISGEVM
jgi:O-antigen/teichoic acid export membrane protein